MKYKAFFMCGIVPISVEFVGNDIDDIETQAMLYAHRLGYTYQGCQYQCDVIKEAA